MTGETFSISEGEFGETQRGLEGIQIKDPPLPDDEDEERCLFSRLHWDKSGAAMVDRIIGVLEEQTDILGVLARAMARAEKVRVE